MINLFGFCGFFLSKFINMSLNYIIMGVILNTTAL
jgi:hypothetical protein